MLNRLLDTGTIDAIETLAEAAARIGGVKGAFGYDSFTILDVVFTDGKPFARIILNDEAPARPLDLKDFDREERRRLFGSILHSSTPVRWRSRHSERPPPLPIPASLHVFREAHLPSETSSGLMIPVHSGLNHAGAVILFGDGKPDLTLSELGALRLFCVSWYARLSQIAVERDGAERITQRELECLRLAAKGMTSEAIAAMLDLSRHTVTHHLVSVTAKLGASNRTHAIAKGVRMGLIR